MSEEKKRLGRPPQPRRTEFDEEILRRLAEGESLRAICRTAGMPPASTVRYWVVDDPAFAAHYTRARSAGIDAQAEETIEISDDQSIDPAARRVMVDARKWFASKMRPAQYGDRITQEISGPGGAPVQSEHVIRFIAPPKAIPGN